MLKNIIETIEVLNNPRVIALCKCKNNLVAVPCEDDMSGYYPEYENSIIIKENVEEIYGEIKAMLLLHDFGDYEIQFATDSWDGFQPASIKNINDYVEFIKWISMYI